MLIKQARDEFHARICREIIRVKDNKDGIPYPNFADSHNRSSIQIATEIVKRLNIKVGDDEVNEQNAGTRFEGATRDFLEQTFGQLNHLRPGEWIYSVSKAISSYSQYEHLAHIEAVLKKDKKLDAALHGDYIVKPDVLISRKPVSDEEINKPLELIFEKEKIASLTPFRAHNQKREIMHASISCKWTIRSDRSQNTRTEALNLMRHRKGNLPHIVAVTAEPLPTRLAALALGTGDLDCVYHFALLELQDAVAAIDNQDQLDILETMVEGNRLKDIADLPFDLAI